MFEYSFSLADVEILLLIIVRISCFVFVAPFFGTANSPARVKIGLSVFVSLLIYCYLAYQRYGRLQMKRSINQNVSLEEMRFFGSILVVVASFIFLYYQFETTTADNPSIE